MPKYRIELYHNDRVSDHYRQTHIYHIHRKGWLFWKYVGLSGSSIEGVQEIINRLEKANDRQVK